MQRLVAFALAVLVGSCLILPAFALPNAASNSRPCCRKNGAHHCGMQSDSSDASDTAGSLLNAKCPSYPRAYVASSIQYYSSVNVPAMVVRYVSQPADLTQVEAGYRISHTRSRQKRGPPTLS